jgi:uncharacterized membrane protein YfcA
VVEDSWHHPGIATPVIVGIVAGAFIGTRVHVRLTNETVRKSFMVVLLILGVQMLVRGIL